MIKSMTGFGNYQIETETYRISIEVKTLNSKFLDVAVRLPRQFADKEQDVRNLVSQRLVRGKVSLNAEFERIDGNEPSVSFNAGLFKKYYKEMEELADLVGSDKNSLFRLAMQQPDVMVARADDPDPEDWKAFSTGCEQAVDSCDTFRKSEGDATAIVLSRCIEQIKLNKQEIQTMDGDRLHAIKERIKGNLHEVIGNDLVDQNRFEQELIYYIEKIDISEELTRLESHISFFMDVMEEDQSNGKKLGFISQEIGREINTIGSKANDAAMQQHVVQMKDALEQIKEQVLNVL